MFKTPSTGGSFFKAAEHMSDLAIVVEAKRTLTEADPFNAGQTREVAIADLAIFRDSADIESGVPGEIMLDASITGTVLVDIIKREGWIGEVSLAVIDKTKSGRGYVWAPASFPGAAEAAEKWYKEREEERAASKADFPFGK